MTVGQPAAHHLPLPLLPLLPLLHLLHLLHLLQLRRLLHPPLPR